MARSRPNPLPTIQKPLHRILTEMDNIKADGTRKTKENRVLDRAHGSK